MRAIGKIGEYKKEGKDAVHCIEFSPSGRLLFGGYDCPEITIWDTINETQMQYKSEYAHTNSVQSFCKI
jgi:hypothetical protein